MKIEVHLLQSFAPSCLNRDDTNTPKMAEFGGATRARVSSQSWKRTVRQYWRMSAEVTGLEVAQRTKQLRKLLLKKLGWQDEVTEDTVAVDVFLDGYYSEMDGKKPKETKVLVFIGQEEVDVATECFRQVQESIRPITLKRLAAMNKAAAKGAKSEVSDAAPTDADGEEGGKKLPGLEKKNLDGDVLKKLSAANSTPDIAMFGRMLADHPERRVDAACQVAHALSTHSVDFATDYFAAVDDIKENMGEIGAGMLGNQGYNAACYYRYALLDRNQLLTNLKGDSALADKTIEAFLRAFTLSIPSAKQNSHAAQSLPSLALFIARDKGVPVSLVNAFAAPIYGEDLIGASIRSLARYQAKMGEMYGVYEGATIACFSDREEKGLPDNLAAFDAGGLDAAVKNILDAVRGTA